MIYVVQEEHSRLVKIGFSTDPWLRHTKIQSDCPGKLTMLSLVAGDTKNERELHKRFAADRVRGEWFRYSDQIAAFVEAAGPPSRPSGQGVSDSARRVALYVEATGASPAAARSWVQRGRIPGWHWSALVAAGVATYAELSAPHLRAA